MIKTWFSLYGEKSIVALPYIKPERPAAAAAARTLLTNPTKASASSAPLVRARLSLGGWGSGEDCLSWLVLMIESPVVFCFIVGPSLMSLCTSFIWFSIAFDGDALCAVWEFERIAFALSSHAAVCVALTGLLDGFRTFCCNGAGRCVLAGLMRWWGSRGATCAAAAAEAAAFLADSRCWISSRLRHRRSRASNSAFKGRLCQALLVPETLTTRQDAYLCLVNRGCVTRTTNCRMKYSFTNTRFASKLFGNSHWVAMKLFRQVAPKCSASWSIQVSWIKILYDSGNVCLFFNSPLSPS